MKFLSLLVLPLLFVGCTKSPVLSPIQSVGCAVEQTVASDIAVAIAGALQCGQSAEIVNSLTAALGNANLCLTPIPAPPAPAAVVAGLVAPKWGKIGDVTAGDLGKKPLVKTQGIVGAIACPIVINTLTGFLSNSVPKAWSCTEPNASIAGLIQTLVATCATAVPI